MEIRYGDRVYEVEKLSGDGIKYNVLKAKAGNVLAKEKLFLNFLPLMKKYAGKALEYREDFTQNFAVAFLDAINAFSFKRKVPFAGYIKNIIKSGFSSLIRKFNKFSEHHTYCSAEAWEAIGNAAAYADNYSAENRETVIKLLEKLTIREQEVLVYTFVLDKSSEEIAAYLKISRKTVLNTKLRAISKLKSKIRKEAVK